MTDITRLADERAYLVLRERLERERADRAGDRTSAQVHARLADLYAERLRRLDYGDAPAGTTKDNP